MALNPKGPHPTTATMDPIPTSAKTWDAVTTTHHAKVRGRRLGENRHHPFFEGDHELSETANVRVGVNRRAVAHIGDGYQVIGTLATEKLAHVGAPAQALIARTTLRSARN